jgi:PAS domain S-box-containing protein
MNEVSENKIKVQETVSSLHSFFDHSDDGMILVDSNGVIREWSCGYEKISGLNKESVIGKIHLWDLTEWLFPLEEQSNEECERVKAELKGVVANMQQKNHIRHIKHSKTGEHRILNILYFPVAMPEGMMLGGISRDVTEEVRHREQLEENERKLSAEKGRLETLSDNLPEGTLYRIVLDRDTGKMHMEFVSATWERITGLTPQSVAEDIQPFHDIILPEDWQRFNVANELSIKNLSTFIVEARINKKGKTRWLRISSNPHANGNKIIWDGIMTDITNRKESEAELLKYREELEYLVKERTEELVATNEELETINEEIAAINDELQSANCELNQYRTQLEGMVEEKTAEVVAQQADLEVLNRRQEILIKVLQIIQSAENIPEAMNVSLAKIGEYAGVSRVYIFEKSADGASSSCVYEWINSNIIHTIKDLHLSNEILQPVL